MELSADSLDPPASKTDEATPEQPARWFQEKLGVKLYPKQVEMVESVRDNKQTSVCGCNSSGKDYTAGRLALWWVCYWRYKKEEAKVVITGPTNRQVEDVVWRNLRSAYVNNGGEVAFGGRLYEIPYLRWDDETFILAFSTDRDYQLQGYHSPHLLVIVTEAHGLAQNHYDALHRLNPERLLLTGNPISEAGEFYDSHHSKSANWHTIDISAYDTPNVIEGKVVVPGLINLDDIASHKANWGEDDPRFKFTVLNEWVAGLGSLIVVPRPIVDDAVANAKAKKYLPNPEDPEVIGVDVARGGLDFSVGYWRKGRTARQLFKVVGQDTQEIADLVEAQHRIRPDAHIVVDGVGVGAGVVDALRRRDIPVFDFQSGNSADDSTRYYNRITEVWWRMRHAFFTGFAIPDDDAIIEQLASRKWRIMSDRRAGLQPKDEMRDEGLKSPDDADALALTFAVAWQLDGALPTAVSDADRLKTAEKHAEDERQTLVWSTAAEFREALRDAGVPTAGGGSRWKIFHQGHRKGNRRYPDDERTR